MPEYDFTALRLRLLQGGVSPKHVSRILTELNDHFEDLTQEGVKRDPRLFGSHSGSSTGRG